MDQQLSGEKIRKVVKVLEVTKSTYFPAFNRLCKEVSQARMEANDNIVYLEPLVNYFNKVLAVSCPISPSLCGHRLFAATISLPPSIASPQM